MILNRRFTLVELLIAVSLAAAVLGIMGGAAWSSLKTVNNTARLMDTTREGAAMVRRIREDLRGCRLDVRRSLEEQLMLAADEIDPASFYAESDEDELLLDIYTTSAVTGPGMPAGLYRVTYRFDSRSGLLERRQAHIGQVEMDGLPWRVVGEGLEYVLMKFYDGEDWLESWDSNEEHALPPAIEVEIGGFRDGRPISYSLTVSPSIRE